jgi:Transposase IS116/IS110/IS902 family
MLEFEQDLGAEWFLDVWELVTTPDKAMRSRETSIARILKSRRIRRLTAADVLAVLRKPPVTVAPGTIDAASAHIRAHRTPESGQPAAHGCAPPARQAVWPPGRADGECDAAILASLPRNGRIVLATLLAEGWDLRRRDYHALRTLCGAAPVTRRSGKSRIITRRLACNPRLQRI